MSEAVLYQSVLQKLGQLSPQHLVELNAFLGILLQKQDEKLTDYISNETWTKDSKIEDKFLEMLLDTECASKEQNFKKSPKFGFGKFKIEIADDFDAPLEDFKDYM